MSLAYAGAAALVGMRSLAGEQAILLAVVLGIVGGMLGGCVYPLDVVGPVALGTLALRAYARTVYSPG